MTHAARSVALALLFSASTSLAQGSPFAEALARRLGRPVQSTRLVDDHLSSGMLMSLGDPLSPSEALPETPPQDPRRAYRGQAVQFEGLLVERLTFRDPDTALEYASRHVQPPAVVDVRGRYVVALSGPRALLPGVANGVLAEAWQGAPAATPRSALAVAETPESNVAFLTAPRGELYDQAATTFKKAEEKFGQAPVGVAQRVSDNLSVTWLDARHQRLRADGQVRVTCDRSGPLMRAVVGQDEAAHARLSRLLDDLARDNPAQVEGQQAQAQAAAPNGVGMEALLGEVGEAIETDITAPIR